MTGEITIQKTQYPDSLELDFGGPRKGGKVYFNSSEMEEAKKRITNIKEIALHAHNELEEFKKKTGEASE